MAASTTNNAGWQYTRMLMNMSYDIVISFFNLVIHTFFRDIRSRGSFHIPKHGAVVLVIAPHHNQFVDGLVVLSSVRHNSRRHIAFLIAKALYDRNFIGHAAKLCSAIPVERAQDVLRLGPGTVRVDHDRGPEWLRGDGTRFTRDCMVKGLVGLPGSLANAPIESIEDDTHLKLKKPLRATNPQSQGKIDRLLADGSSYKVAPHIDNNVVFRHVFSHLNAGRVLGIFPEGGSHDRPDLLPLKPGVAIMALGAVASQLTKGDAVTPVSIVPVGLNYFHPHKFRSRVVIEYGKPIVVDEHLGQLYNQNSRDTVGKLLETITLGLKEVTVTCDDYETLMAVQAARRLYTSNNREDIPLPLVVEMNRRLVKGYNKYADHPDLIDLKSSVGEYNNQLMRLGIHDHQVEALSETNRLGVVLRFLERLFKFSLFMGLSLPGIFLFSPVFITARRISRKKAKEALAGSAVKIKAKDVLSTWKIMVALILAPALYIFYSVIGTVLIIKLELVPYDWVSVVLTFVVCYCWAVLTTFASLRIGEIGVDYYKSLKPLFISIVSHHSLKVQLDNLKQTRRQLSLKVTEFCNRYGPHMFEDYDEFYRDYNALDGETDYANDNTNTNAKVLDSWSQQMADVADDDFNLDDLSNMPIFSSVSDSSRSISSDDSDVEVEDIVTKDSDVSIRLRAVMKDKQAAETF